MKIPVEITLREIEHTPAIINRIEKKAQKLKEFNGHILYCKVVVDMPQKHKHQGKEFSVHIKVGIPGKPPLIVNRQIHQDLYVAIRNAFAAMQRQLEDYSHIQRGQTKTHLIRTGKVTRLFDNYGFIEDVDGQEYYFHQNNLSQSRFEDLTVGLTVYFIEIIAGDGLQANHVCTTKHIIAA